MWDFASYSRGDWFGLVGMILSALGFPIAFYQLWKTKRAADSARKASLDTRQEVRRFDSLLEVASVSDTINGIKRAVRSGDWPQIPHLIDSVRKPLIIAQTKGDILSKQDRTSLQDALVFFGKLEVDLINLSDDQIKKKKGEWTNTIIEISDTVVSIMSSTDSMELRGD